MKLLSFESSSASASVALTDGESLIAQSFQNCGLTHSRTLLPMAESLLANCGIPLCAVDGFAVAAGPGSFTGIRIGTATVKGLAFGLERPCVGVSTLEAMARGLEGLEGSLCCVMDARAGQVYNAMFTLESGTLLRLCPDRAIPLSELAEEIGETTQILVGDGAKMCYTEKRDCCPGLRLAPIHLRYPTGYGVARAALPLFEAGKTVSAQELDAKYLRAPQAERVRKQKMGGTFQ